MVNFTYLFFFIVMNQHRQEYFVAQKDALYFYVDKCTERDVFATGQHAYREVHVCMLIISKSNYNNVSIIISIEFFCEMIWPDSQIINIYTFNTKSVSHIIANLSN